MIVAVLVPLVGMAIVALSEPAVVAAVVERFNTTLVPAPALGLFTWSGPVAAPNVPAPESVNVPELMIVPPEYVLAPLSVSVLAPDLFRTPTPEITPLSVWLAGKHRVSS